MFLAFGWFTATLPPIDASTIPSRLVGTCTSAGHANVSAWPPSLGDIAAANPRRCGALGLAVRIADAGDVQRLAGLAWRDSEDVERDFGAACLDLVFVVWATCSSVITQTWRRACVAQALPGEGAPLHEDGYSPVGADYGCARAMA
jgi:hypothetical protein